MPRASAVMFPIATATGILSLVIVGWLVLRLRTKRTSTFVTNWQGAAMADDPPSWTLQRQELREWCRRNASTLLPLYEGCILLLDSTNPARHHFIASGLRDIINILPQVIGAGKLAPRLDYAKRVSAIAEHWP